ncbi:MAG: alcohol dehydrogenase catalytic domain-containing protein, partial [Eubacteriaceae bacterium]|nr:alcohol dehydrogenase catalytic domain-containing protein [Eubacteriaceae bacterium]
MINHVYQLTAPKAVAIKFEDTPSDNMIVVQPEYMAICHADQRYYQGNRSPQALAQKLPMALIHECCGRVVSDPFGQFLKGQLVALIPNAPSQKDTEIYENYRRGSHFHSSGLDGFMREIVCMPAHRIIPIGAIDPKIAAI